MRGDFRVQVCKLQEFAVFIDGMNVDGYTLHSWNTFEEVVSIDPRIQSIELMVAAVFERRAGQAERGQ